MPDVADDAPSAGSAPPDDEPPLDELIDTLTHQLADPREGTDVAGLSGDLAGLLLEVYERDGDLDALSAALDYLHQAMDWSPGHDDRRSWLFGLGLGHAARAEACGSVNDFNRAFGYVSRLFVEGPVESDADRGQLAEFLAAVYWSRHLLVRRTHDADAVGLLDAARGLVRVFGEPAGTDDGESRFRQMMAGVSLVELYQLSADRDDLDRGIDALGAALRDPASDTPCLGVAAVRLAEAHRERAVLDESLSALDMSIGVGERAITWSSDDPMARLMAYQNQAVAYGMRSYLTDDRDDLDRAIRSWRAHIDAHDGEAVDAWKYADLGELLRVRGELDENLAEVTESVTLLTQATGAAPDDSEPEYWRTWYRLARAHRAQWSVGRVPGSLQRARGCLDRARRADCLDDDDLVAVHTEAYYVAGDTFVQDAGGGDGAADPAIAEFAAEIARARAAVLRAAQADVGARASLALQLAHLELRFDGPHFIERDPDRVRSLLDVAELLSDPPVAFQTLLDYCVGLWSFLDGSPDQMVSGGTDWGAARLARAQLTADSVDDSIRDGMLKALSLAAQLRALSSSSLRLHRAAGSVPAAVTSEDQRDGPGTEPDVDTQLVAAMLALSLPAVHGAIQSFADVPAEIVRTIEALPMGSGGDGTSRASVVRGMRLLFAAGRGEPVQPLPEVTTTFLRRDEPVDDATLSPHLLHATAQLMSAVVHDDIADIRAAVAGLSEYAELTSHTSPLRFGASALIGVGNVEIGRREPQDRAAAEHAVRWLTEAASMVRGPDDRHWSTIAILLAEASRLAGGRENLARSRELGLSALVSYGCQVMLQAGTDDALAAARNAGRVARQVASWCVTDSAHEELVAALDMSRGLALRTLSDSREVADRLAHLGRTDLAEQWRATRGLGRDHVTGAALRDVAADASGFELPDDLRAQVLAALADAPGQDLFQPVRPDEIRPCLASLDADALIYLVAADQPYPGAAVLVPAHGEVEVLRLGGLSHPPDALVHPGTHTRGDRDLMPAGAYQSPRASDLDELCRWAWDSAMGTLLDRVRQWHLGRPARLVLVPMGPLALVPWHAAYTPTPPGPATPAAPGRHYAVQEAMFSYAPSARMLIGAAHHPLRPARAALIVGNPGGDLAGAGNEAWAVRQTFYPFGTYLGQPAHEASGAGTPDQVRAWLATASGPTLLHFACHGYTDPKHPSRGHLRLAGGILTAADLVDVARLSSFTIDRVFLAACTTNVTGEEYDEAFSLATAFLAAGAHTVFGSLWAVPDAQTSLLMFMIHHFLNVDGLTPMTALHAAQLWMLDPDRRVPAEMPRSLTDLPDGELDAPLVWAAFTHLGR